MKLDSVPSVSGLSRRAALGRAASVGVALGLGSSLGRAAAQEATPAAMAGHPLVGTWIVDRNPADPAEMPTTNVLTADGGLIDPSVGAAGVWVATGERTADFTLIAIFEQGMAVTGQPAEGGGSYFVVRGSLAVDAGNDTATATVSQTQVASDGTVLLQMEQGTSTYLRLRVEPQDAVGQPLAGFPAWTSPPVATPTP
jgi:hypothetical protein